jgi:2-oxoisovalerate dehydrogenase E1 component alpha subunit
MVSAREKEAADRVAAGVQDSAEIHPIAGEEAARAAAASSENGHDDHHAIASAKPKVHYSDLGLTPDDLLKMYYFMLLARSLDERMWLLNRQGKIAFVISCQGQEGAQVGLAYALQAGKDFACPYYRDLGMLVTLGQTPRDVMLSVFGRAENTDSGGRQMPGHFGIRKLNVPTGSSPIATQNVHAAGIALAFKLRGIDGVAITSIGEGGTSQGDWHEAMNFAATMDLPMIMMVENNRYAISEPQEKQMKIRNVADRAVAYGCPGVVVDGNDILDVYRASIEAVRRARAGEGPTLIEAKVNRFTPHSSDDDDKRYRDPNEVKMARAQQDPVTLFRDLMMSEGVLTEEKEQEIRDGIKRQVDDATEYAIAAADPKPEDLYTYVYADRTEATVESQYESLGAE